MGSWWGEARRSGAPLIVLGLDTATWTAAVGVARDDDILAEAVHRAERSHTASLPGLIDRVMAAAGVAVDAIDAVAVSIGPGSFTGLRVALGLGKGIAFAAGVPLVAVPTLEALALAVEAPPGTTVCAALDARKQEVYAAMFRVETAHRVVRRTPDEALSPAALALRLRPDTWLVGDAAEAYPQALAGHGHPLSFAAHPPRGGVVAREGARRLRAGEGRHPSEVEPVYVRPPEAVRMQR